jgi:UrcA family protein
MRHKTVSLIAASIATLSVASAALAADTGELRSTGRVRYGDLNLASDAGVAHLYARLQSAANRVCESTSFPDVIDHRCAAQALDGAVAAVGNDRLTALHRHAPGARQVVTHAR